MTSIDIHAGHVRVSGVTVKLSNTIGQRLAGTPDPWASLSRHRYDVAAARRRLATITP